MSNVTLSRLILAVTFITTKEGAGWYSVAAFVGAFGGIDGRVNVNNAAYVKKTTKLCKSFGGALSVWESPLRYTLGHWLTSAGH